MVCIHLSTTTNIYEWGSKPGHKVCLAPCRVTVTTVGRACSSLYRRHYPGGSMTQSRHHGYHNMPASLPPAHPSIPFTTSCSSTFSFTLLVLSPSLLVIYSLLLPARIFPIDLADKIVVDTDITTPTSGVSVLLSLAVSRWDHERRQSSDP